MKILKDQFWSDNKTPHCLIELSKKQFSRMQDNMVKVRHPLIKSNKIEDKSPFMVYEEYTLGKNITLYEDKDQCYTKSFNMERIKNRYVIIVGEKAELEKVHPNPWFFNNLYDSKG